MKKTVMMAVLILSVVFCGLTGCQKEQDPSQQEPSAPEKAAAAKKDPLVGWQPQFDPSSAQYTYLLSNLDHPTIEGVAVGYHIRDKVWERSGGRLYVDYRPLSQLGQEKGVLSKLKLGAVQGVLCSSVAAANISDTLGIVNLPFVIDSADKLEQFRNDPELFDEFRNSALRQGLMVVDITSYGSYGWATNTPVRTLAEARQVNFRIAQAPVNTDFYRAWGMKFTVMPWGDVPQALQTGVIDGLDHTPTVCNITHKFEVARYFTRVDYAQGLFIHLMNKAWLERLPEDLRRILLEVIAEESAAARQRARVQQQEQIAAAEAVGVQFFELAAEDRAELIRLSEPVYATWGAKIGAEYLAKVRQRLAR
ncbi:TRAP proton/solute symporter, periplasmic substrate-binding protein [Syntrophotalea carbinolica DSM 2380]|uniref:TRAP proton/solute symporter, periplasmic substrate-binding protein n=1 Tax=Syntrophotalea carbinolica (strain DSM 2380 / NBRC 103641 / GraBd1) TaxID=338963 RepID=Q3A055_SYNC1|nr:TRAP transporter substrate-binding protein [Syntrophotalea carbinolica]ABA90252.1 TRAP proton/solute symporter, periplasmic substrate-binding protein [Syntrophotalea carbinolica DSM 2380]